MPQSLSRVLVHLVFSTKNRTPWLTAEIQEELFAYLATVLDDHDCPSIRVGGEVDHVHVFFGLSRTITQAEIVEKVKTSSSKWIKTKGSQFADFRWQAGYGIFSVSQSNAADVIEYILKQEEHHRKISYQDEFRRLLQRYGVEFDEQYVWD